MHNSAVNLGLFIGFLIWVPVTIAIVTLLGWMIQAEIDAMAGLAGIVLCLAIGALGFMSPDPNIGPFILVVAISMVVLFPIGRNLKEKKELAQLDVEQVERAYVALDKNPNDIGAKIKIARILFQRKNVGHAVALAEDALKGMPKDMFDEEFRMVSRWKALTPVHAFDVVCIQCSAKNKPGAVYCYRCKAPVLLHYAKGHWVHPAVLRRLLLGWVAAVISIVGIPVAGSSLPFAKSLPVVVLLLSISVFLGWVALRGFSKQAT